MFEWHGKDSLIRTRALRFVLQIKQTSVCGLIMTRHKTDFFLPRHSRTAGKVVCETGADKQNSVNFRPMIKSFRSILGGTLMKSFIYGAMMIRQNTDTKAALIR